MNLDSNEPYSQAQQGSVTEVTVKRNCNHSNLDRGSRGGASAAKAAYISSLSARKSSVEFSWTIRATVGMPSAAEALCKYLFVFGSKCAETTSFPHAKAQIPDKPVIRSDGFFPRPQSLGRNHYQKNNIVSWNFSVGI